MANTTYKLGRHNGVVKDGTRQIPEDKYNYDWIEYQKWLAKGNVPEPADPDNSMLQTKAQFIDDTINTNPLERGLIKALAAKFGITPAQLVQEIKQNS